MNDDHPKLFIYDDFYDNPDEQRYLALRQGINNHGYSPGMRSLPCFNMEAHDKLTKIFNKNIYPTGDCYAFQFNTATDVSWIHTDTIPNDIIMHPEYNYWAAVVYLTPNPVLTGGTSLYTHRETKVRNMRNIIMNNSRSKGEKQIFDVNNTGSDISKWYNATSIGNVYNRLIVYDASYFHGSTENFGTCKENCRLIQVFFFHTNKNDDGKNIKVNEYRTNEFMNHMNVQTVRNTNGLLNRLKEQYTKQEK